MCRRFPRKTILAWEKEHLGAYLSEHPLTDVYAEARRAGEQYVAISELDGELAGQTVRVLGCVAGVRKMTTRANKTMAVVTVEDLGWRCRSGVVPRTLRSLRRAGGRR